MVVFMIRFQFVVPTMVLVCIIFKVAKKGVITGNNTQIMWIYVLTAWLTRTLIFS